MVRRCFHFKSEKELFLGEKTLIMGILNITPDSFSDGGDFFSIEKAKEQVRKMLSDGADIIDIGAESTRPGAKAISLTEEIERLRPVLAEIVNMIDVPISIDTYKAEVADFALKCGVDIINDIWGLQYVDEPMKMAEVAAKYNAPVIVMHNTELMADSVDVIAAEKDFFRKSFTIAKQKKIPTENLILDPGIGFGKNTIQNLELVRRLRELKEIDGKEYPMLLGVSLKRFIGDVLDLPVNERLEGTLAANAIGIKNGADIVRVHDVKETVRMAKIVDAIENS